MRMWQVRAVIRPLLADPTSELTKQIRGHGTHPAWLLYGIADILAGANWQRSGGRQARPRPLDRMLAEQARASSLANLQAEAADPDSHLSESLRYLAQFDPAAAAASEPELWLPDGAR